MTLTNFSSLPGSGYSALLRYFGFCLKHSTARYKLLSICQQKLSGRPIDPLGVAIALSEHQGDYGFKNSLRRGHPLGIILSSVGTL